MATDEYWSQSYTTDFIGALSIDEQLSFPPFQGPEIGSFWIGPDATLTQCFAVDYTHRVGTVFSFHFRLDFLSKLTGLPREDFTLIAIAEFLIIVCFFSASCTFLSWKTDFVCRRQRECVSLIKYKKAKKPYSSILGPTPKSGRSRV